MKYVHFDKNENVIRGISENGIIGGFGSSEWLLLAYPEGVHHEDISVKFEDGKYIAYEDADKKAARFVFEAQEKINADNAMLKAKMRNMDIESISIIRSYIIEKLKDWPTELLTIENKFKEEKAKLK